MSEHNQKHPLNYTTPTTKLHCSTTHISLCLNTTSFWALPTMSTHEFQLVIFLADKCALLSVWFKIFTVNDKLAESI